MKGEGGRMKDETERMKKLMLGMETLILHPSSFILLDKAL
jgi:hypothetical protein